MSEEHNNSVAEEESVTPEVSDIPISDNAYYIQVAVVKTESALNNYLKELKKSDLSYEVKPVNVKGNEAHRVLVGPYLSRSEAKEDLAETKKIEKGAFIKKLQI
jgi:cell division septation protein DedD